MDPEGAASPDTPFSPDQLAWLKARYSSSSARDHLGDPTPVDRVETPPEDNPAGTASGESLEFGFILKKKKKRKN